MITVQTYIAQDHAIQWLNCTTGRPVIAKVKNKSSNDSCSLIGIQLNDSSL